MLQQRWHHRYSLFFSSSCLSFISSPSVLVCIHLRCLFICTVSLLITSFFHLLSNDLWDQFDPQTNSLLLLARWSVSLALFLIVCLFFSLSHSNAHLAAFFSPCLSLLFLFSCHLTCLFLLSWPFYSFWSIPILISFALIQPSANSLSAGFLPLPLCDTKSLFTWQRFC